MTDEPPPSGRVANVLTVVKGLTLTNVLIMALMAMVAVPVYTVWVVLNDPKVLDRFLSSYDEYTELETGCTVRTVRLRGGPWRWSISTGFAFQGNDHWNVSVILASEPDRKAVTSYCTALDLIVEKMLRANGQ